MNVGPGRTYTTKGATALQGTAVQFDLFGLDYRDIAPLYEALLAEMEQPETVAGINFGMAFLDSQRDYPPEDVRSEEHTSELQSLMRTSYAVFCLKKQHTLIQYNKKQTVIMLVIILKHIMNHKTHSRY